jgi:hypothetical protein
VKELGFISRRAQDIFLQNVYAGSGPHVALCYVETLCLFPRGKVGGGGREIDHSLLSSAEVKNKWSYTSSAPRLHGLDRGTST